MYVQTVDLLYIFAIIVISYSLVYLRYLTIFSYSKNIIKRILYKYINN